MLIRGGCVKVESKEMTENGSSWGADAGSDMNFQAHTSPQGARREAAPCFLYAAKDMKKYGRAWEKKRAWIMRRDGYKSQIAARYGRNVPGDTVHHILPVEFFPEYRYVDWNLITITRQEHNRLHDRLTHRLTEEGLELMTRTAMHQGMNIAEIMDRMETEEEE